MDDPTAIVGRGSVLCLAPHPDDESLGCGALLAACWRAGIPAHVVCLTDGAASHPGSRSWPPDMLAALRRAELEEAVSILGGNPECNITYLDHPDAGLHQIDATTLIHQIDQTVDRLSACPLLVPSPHDPHCDHVTAAEAAEHVCNERRSLRLMYYPFWSRWAAAGEAAPQVLRTFRHTFDDPSVRARKAAAIAAHASQLGRVVLDDPEGFVMPEGFAEMFVTGPEILDELRR